MFTKKIIQAAVDKSETPTGDALLDTMFLKYNEASPRDDSPVYYRFLYYLAQSLPNERLAMLELGCKYGAASMHFLKGGGEQSLAVDCTDQIDHGLFEREVGLKFMFHKAMSTAPELIRLATPLLPNIIFIDTDHAYETTAAEYAMWRPFSKKGAIMLFDDICAPEYGCTKFWNEIEGDKVTYPDLHPRGWGFGVLFT